MDRLRPKRLPPPLSTDNPAYEVGYCRPPAHTRFKPGQSGNPSGRPKGSKNGTLDLPALNEERLKEVIMIEAYRMTPIRDGDRVYELPVVQAVIRSVALNAAKGNHRAQKMFSELVQWVERENKALNDHFIETALDYKKHWEQELERRELTGETGPEPLPHPDDIHLNMGTGLVEIRGPMTPEQKESRDHLIRYKAVSDERIADLERSLADKPDDEELLDTLAEERALRAMITEVLPDPPELFPPAEMFKP